MTARTSYADLGWLPDCENEPDSDDDEAVPVRVDDDHPDLNADDLPDPWAQPTGEQPW